jgi:hypothetical protein
LRFIYNAALHVNVMADDVLVNIASRNLWPGQWHPNGFATFEVANIVDTGLVRLHVWPRKYRPALRGHPPIHNHGFQLFSRVLAGEYVETQYSNNPCDWAGLSRSAQRLSQYVVAAADGTGEDTVSETGAKDLVMVTASGLRSPAGTSHALEAGQFHSTPIPLGGMCATLAVLSPRIEGRIDVLYGRPGFQSNRRARLAVNRDEWKIIQSQVLENMAVAPKPTRANIV